MRTWYISAGGLRLRVARHGTGEPLLLVNGLGGCIEGWQPFRERLPGRDVIMVDHPGMGLSEVPERILTIGELAGLYCEVLDRLEVQRADVLGFSFGGVIAQELAHSHPDRVGALVLAATSCGWGGVPASPLTLMAASNPLRYQSRTIREMSAPMIYRGRAGRQPELFYTELRGMNAHRASLTGVMYQTAAYSMWSSLPWLCSLHLPTLVLGGDEDPMAPAVNSRLLAATIPGAELHVFDQAGHLFLFDLPDQAGPLVSDFLTRSRAAVA